MIIDLKKCIIEIVKLKKVVLIQKIKVADEIIQQQLLIRALDSKYLATQVISKGIHSLFKGNLRAELVARVLSTYYNLNDEPITGNVLKGRMAKLIDSQIQQHHITEEQEIDYYNYANELFKEQVDNSTEMLSQVDKYTRQKLAEFTILKNAQLANNDENYDLVKNLSHQMDEIDNLDITGQGNHVISVYEDLDEKEKLYQELAVDQVRMGLPSMDKVLNGGLSKGEVGMLAASSGFGKTSYLVAFSVNYALHGKNVLYISLEEKAGRMLLRFDRSTLGKTSRDIIEKFRNPDTHKLTVQVNPEFKEKSKDIYSKMMSNKNFGKLYFYRNYPQTVTIDQVSHLIKATERANNIKLDVVVLDYPDLLLNPEDTGNESVDGSLQMQRLRHMAQEKDVVLWTAAQLNRSNTDKLRKTTDNIQGSYRQRNDVEFIATVNRTPIEYSHGYTRLIIDKFRNSEGNFDDTLYFKYDPLTMRLSEENDAEKLEHNDLLNQAEDEIKAKYKSSKSNYVDKKQAMADKINQSLGN